MYICGDVNDEAFSYNCISSRNYIHCGNRVKIPCGRGCKPGWVYYHLSLRLNYLLTEGFLWLALENGNGASLSVPGCSKLC